MADHALSGKCRDIRGDRVVSLDPSVDRFVDDGSCQRMLTSTPDRAHEGDQVVAVGAVVATAIVATGCTHADYGRCAFGESTRLVKGDRPDLAQFFQPETTLEEHSESSPVGDSRDDADRCT